MIEEVTCHFESKRLTYILQLCQITEDGKFCMFKFPQMNIGFS